MRAAHIKLNVEEATGEAGQIHSDLALEESNTLSSTRQ